MGLYIDSDGPIGVMRHLAAKEAAYFRYLPMYYPYVIKKAPKTFITQFGGGISTEVALAPGSKDVTVAEGNRAILAAFHGPVFKDFTDNILGKVRVIDYEGRHFLAQTKEKFDVIDLSLANSTGLSNPGGFAVVEKFPYTRGGDGDLHARARRRRRALGHDLEQGRAAEVGAEALRDDGRRRARRSTATRWPNSFFVASSYLSTATVLYKRGGFTADEIADAAQAHARHVVRRDLFAGLLLRRLADRSRARAAMSRRFFAAPQNGPPAPATTPPTPTRPRRPTTPRPDAARAAAARPTKACCPRP